MADKIFRVNMTDLSTSLEAVPSDWAGLGGRGLTSTIVAAEVPPTCHPLGPNNRLIFAPGLLSGTPAVNSGRLSCGAKSPLTGTIKEANSGGTSAQILAKMGCKALIIEGQPQDESWYSLRLSPEGVRIEKEEELIGKGNFAVVETLEYLLSKSAGIITLGQCGEMQMPAANISIKDPDGHLRSCG
ncbi:MAG: aldehyde ferredoxin oxidoreductase, partial [Desulfobulbaceae bacterium]|nr:aldehyde ferredoxin oxidoreductase [Desulfobulbaceae bacterium]